MAKLFLLPLLAGAMAAPANAPPHFVGGTPAINPLAAPERCPETPMSLARKQGSRPVPRNLADLPPAQTFAAVDRRVAGCPAPMLLSESRGR